MEKPLNFVFIGRSGCGKDTQAELLKNKFPYLVAISTGDMMRDLAKQNSDSGKRIKTILDEGGLPFDDIAITLWMHKIAYSIREDQGILADGFPRRLNEAKALDEFLKWLERNGNTKYLHIDISREEAFKRLELRGRADDTDKQINKRLDYFEERVMQAINYYQDQGVLIKINGEQSREAIHEEIMSKI